MVTHCAAVPLTSVLTVFVNVILPAIMNVVVLMRCAMVGIAYSVLREGLYATESVAGKVPYHVMRLLVNVQGAARGKRNVLMGIAVALIRLSAGRGVYGALVVST